MSIAGSFCLPSLVGGWAWLLVLSEYGVVVPHISRVVGLRYHLCGYIQIWDCSVRTCMVVLGFGWCGGSSQLTDSKTNATSSNQASARRTGYNGSETCFLRTLTMNQVNHDKAHQAPVPGAELDEFLPYQL